MKIGIISDEPTTYNPFMKVLMEMLKKHTYSRAIKYIGMSVYPKLPYADISDRDVILILHSADNDALEKKGPLKRDPQTGYKSAGKYYSTQVTTQKGTCIIPRHVPVIQVIARIEMRSIHYQHPWGPVGWFITDHKNNPEVTYSPELVSAVARNWEKLCRDILTCSLYSQLYAVKNEEILKFIEVAGNPEAILELYSEYDAATAEVYRGNPQTPTPEASTPTSMTAFAPIRVPVPIPTPASAFVPTPVVAPANASLRENPFEPTATSTNADTTNSKCVSAGTGPTVQVEVGRDRNGNPVSFTFPVTYCK